MAIVGTEIHLYQSATVNDTASNGGRISSTVIPTGQSNSWWPNVTDTQLTAGATQYRKSFVRIDNASDEVGYNLRVGLWKPTPGEDAIYLFAGTQTDLQSGISSPDLVGAGTLDSSVIAGASSIDVLVEDGAVIIFRDGETIRISDQTTVGGAGNAEFHVINGTPTVDGDVVTITLTGTLANAYSNTNTYVSSLLEQATVTGTTSNKVVTSSAGTFDETKVTVGNLGSMYQQITLTFTSATAYTATSDLVTFSPSTGSINSTYAPTNVGVGAAYVSIPTTAFGGTFANGDTVVFKTTPPAMPIWEERVIPSGASAIASQTRTLMIFVES